MSPPDLPRPRLALTLGDPCGIGPEVVAGALAEASLRDCCAPLVVGDPDLLAAAVRLRAVRLEVVPVADPDQATGHPGLAEVWSPVAIDRDELTVGRICPEGGRAAVEWVMAAIDLAMAGRVHGLVTAPLNKEAMRRAGFPYAGHTELLGQRTGTRDYRMMLASERLKVVHATTHVALRDVPGRLTAASLDATLSLACQALRDLDIAAPRLAVAGLNPHAGESGLFGTEDDEVVRPAVERARARGGDVAGPLPGDTAFLRAWRGEFDGVVAMYHDQGHIPVKLVAFDQAVNVTLGLPIVRTSVDHGTAFDIAGRGVADPTNMTCAIRLGARLARGRARGPASATLEGSTP
ncbi:MAG: 4-hydroxythreonine-4-phosphate dehydrogenase PdxA [Gemmatimonadota bacterium]